MAWRGATLATTDDRMRNPVHFDGMPDLFSRTKALFAETSRLQIRYATPRAEHHMLRRDAKGRLILSGWRAFFTKAA